MPRTEHAPLHERLTALALDMQEKSHQMPVEWTGDGMENGALGSYLRDHAYSLAEFARQVQEEYVRLSDTTEQPTAGEHVHITNAAALRLGQITVYGGPVYAGFDFLSVGASRIGVVSPRFPNGGCGIDTDGSTSS